jgi:2,2-dialkylglycine decarboxylase (pyruvate)
VKDKKSKAPADALGSAVTSACLERGLHMNIVQLPGMGGIFRIAPPLTISEEDLHTGVDILEASLEVVLDDDTR